MSPAISWTVILLALPASTVLGFRLMRWADRQVDRRLDAHLSLRAVPRDTAFPVPSNVRLLPGREPWIDELEAVRSDDGFRAFLRDKPDGGAA